MLIYNKKLSVSPITTHIRVKNISKNISKKLIVNKLLTINKFFIKRFNFKPRIGLLGLNPHNYELRTDSEEKRIIIPAIKRSKKHKILVLTSKKTNKILNSNISKFNCEISKLSMILIINFIRMLKTDKCKKSNEQSKSGA